MPKYTEFQENLHKLLESYDPYTLYNYNDNVEHAISDLPKGMYDKFIEDIDKFCKNRSSDYNLDKFVEKVCMTRLTMYVRINTDLMYCKLMLKYDTVPIIITYDELRKDLYDYFKNIAELDNKLHDEHKMIFNKLNRQEVENKLISFCMRVGYFNDNRALSSNMNSFNEQGGILSFLLYLKVIYIKYVHDKHRNDFRKE